MAPYEICVMTWASGWCGGEDPLLEYEKGDRRAKEFGECEERCVRAGFAGISPDPVDRHVSGEGASLTGGLLAGDLLMTLPFVPPNAERSWISSMHGSGSGDPAFTLEQYVVYVWWARLWSFCNIDCKRRYISEGKGFRVNKVSHTTVAGGRHSLDPSS
jgi:hypothetical protein